MDLVEVMMLLFQFGIGVIRGCVAILILMAFIWIILRIREEVRRNRHKRHKAAKRLRREWRREE